MNGPTELFDLDNFAHARIFNGIEFVWEVLAKLSDYVSKNTGRKTSIHATANVMPGSFVDKNSITIGEGTIVEPGAMIYDGAIIGSNVLIRQGAYIRGPVIIGDDCLVGHSSEIKNSIMLDGSKAPHFAYVGDSVLGNRTNLGAGTIFSNLRILPGTVRVKDANDIWDTGLRKFGGILGDDAETGCNVVLNPGTIVGPRSIIYPNCTVSGIIPSDTIVKVMHHIEQIQRQ